MEKVDEWSTVKHNERWSKMHESPVMDQMGKIDLILSPRLNALLMYGQEERIASLGVDT